jgi:hypothetical protein
MRSFFVFIRTNQIIFETILRLDKALLFILAQDVLIFTALPSLCRTSHNFMKTFFYGTFAKILGVYTAL